MTIDDYRGKGWYALRRTLPPWRWEENLQELVECCPEYGIDEVIVMVDTEEFSHHLPTIEWLTDYQPVLFEISEALENIGVVYSLNPWVTLVHADRGRNCRALFPQINFMAGHDGTQCNDCACPLSTGWREHTAALWKIYAETRPAIIWVEDDIRIFNHRPVKYGCFCEEHLRRFSDEIGEKITREQLVSSLLEPGPPHPFREKWLDMQGNIMVDVAGLLEKAVHSVSPATKLGLMSSGPENHCLEGRNWHSLVTALSGTHTPVSRPPLYNYVEGHLRGLYYVADSVRRTRYAFPANTIELTEVESFPFTQYNKSTMFTFLQSAISLAMGAHGVTLDFFDHCGTPMRDNIEILEALKVAKPYLRELSTKTLPAGKFSGIRIVHHDQASSRKQLWPGADYGDLWEESFGWEDILQGLGFATTYDQSDVVALTGQTIRCLARDEVLTILSGGMLCDLSAALALQDMGYGEYLGVTVRRTLRRDSEPIAAEHLVNTDFGGGKHRFISLGVYPHETLIGELAPHPDAFAVSEIVNADTDRLYPGLTLFENTLKGRIAVYPVDMRQTRFEFMRPARQRLLQKVLGWLSRDAIPLFVSGGHNVLPFRMEQNGRTLIAVFCLSLDPYNNLEITAAMPDKKVRGMEILHREDEWREFHDFTLDQGELRITYNDTLDFRRPVVFAVHCTG